MNATKLKQTEIGIIPKDWEEFTLGDLIDIKHGFAFKGEYFTEIPNENILLTPGNFRIGGGFKADKFKYYIGDFPSEYILHEGGIIITMTDLSKMGDTLGYPAKIPYLDGKNYLHNQRLGLVIFKTQKVDKGFLYWLLRTRSYQRFIVNTSSGSTVKHTSPNRIKEFKFFAPIERLEQSTIARILSDLDDKIEINQQMNKTLEAIGQAIFKRWFVDFEFPNEESKPYKLSGGKMVDSELGEMPKGWQVNNVTKLFTLEYGWHLPEWDRKEGDVPVFGSGGLTGYHNSHFVEGPGIIIGRAGKVGSESVYYSHLNFCPIETTFYVLIENKRIIRYLYFFLKTLETVNTGSSVPNLSRRDIHSAKIKIPDVKVIEAFDKIAKTLFDQIKNNEKEIDYLSQIRDSLLPKLMSGKIRVDMESGG